MEYPWDWILFGVYAYLSLGGFLVAPIYMETSKDEDVNRRIARGILLIMLWGPVGLILIVKWVIRGSWWIMSNAMRKD